MDESVDLWLAREILVHESALMRYLLRAWPQHDEIHDLRQEIYVRIYETSTRSRPAQPKAFLFTVARHLPPIACAAAASYRSRQWVIRMS